MGLRSNKSEAFRDSCGGLLLKMWVVATALLVAGCAASTVAPEDPQVVSEVLPYIRDGQTPRKEILRRLGEPDYRHEGGRIVAYKMWMCAGEEQVPFSPKTRCRDHGTYNLILVFGPHNLLEQHSLVRVK